MARNNRGILEFNDVHIIFRNFSGAASKYNREGDRSFGLVITDPEQAKQMVEEGWNIKIRPPRTEDEDTFYYLMVKISYKNGGPNVYLATKGTMVELNEDTIECLDRVSIQRVDLDIRPYEWEVNGKTGISAYLQAIKVTQNYNRFEHMGDELER